MSTIAGVTANQVLNTYTYQYKTQTRATLDANNDSRWDRAEVQKYADAYKEATGTSLDVNKIFEKYGDGGGYITYNQWDTVYGDDALGFAALKEYAAKSTAGTSSTSSASVNLDAVSGFVYRQGNALMPRLDKDYDGLWSKTELQNYAAAYEKATGTKLNVDGILEKYGREDGMIDYAGQNKIKEDDALGFKLLNDAGNKELDSKASTGKDVANEIKDNWFARKTGASGQSNSYDLSEIMASMSPANKAYFTTMIARSDNLSSLLNNFVTSNPVSDSMYGMYSAMSQRNLVGLYGSSMYSDLSTGSMSNQLLNMLV